MNEDASHVGISGRALSRDDYLPVLDEWHQPRTEKKLLAKLRMRHAKGHKFAATKDEWFDE
jgi:hypothetical protein